MRLTLAQHGDRAVFTVEDDGVGFTPGEKREDSFGLDIITLTVRDKLGGKLQIQSGPEGTKAMFDFY